MQQWRRRLVPIAVAFGLLFGGLVATQLVASPSARAVGTYNNATIATDALADVGDDPAPGGGQCKQFVDDMVADASGGTQSLSGYMPADYEAAGAIEVSSANATEGDIIQITPAGSTDANAVSLEENNPNNSADRLHTTIITANNGGGSFNLVDANFTAPLTVGTHTLNPFTSSWDAGSDVHIYQMGTASGGGGSGGGTTTSSRPAAVVRDASHMEAFYRDVNGNLQDMGWDANVGWVINQRASNVASNPAAVSRTSSTMDVFYRDTSNDLETMGWDANNTPGWNSPWALISNGSVTGDPAVVARDASDMDVFYRSNAGGLVHRHWDATNGWAAAENVVTGGTVAGNPVAVSRNSGQFDVFYRDTSNNLVSVGWNGSWYSGGTVISNGSVTGDPAVVALDASNLEVFYRSNVGGLVHRHWNSTSGWATAANLVTGGTVADNPGAVVRDSGHLDVFYRDTSNNLEDVGWDVNSGWTAVPSIQATNAADNPVAIARTSSNMDVFYRGFNGNNSVGFFDSGWDANIGWAQAGLGGTPA